MIDETLAKFDAAVSLACCIEQVDVKVLPVKNYSSGITVGEGDNGKSVVEWKGTVFRDYPNDPPPELSEMRLSRP